MDPGDLGAQVSEAVERSRRARRDGDALAARRWAKRALEVAGNDPRDRTGALAMLAQIARDDGRSDESMTLYREALELCPAGAPLARAYLLRHLGDLEREAGSASAEPLLEEALALYRELLPSDDASLANAVRPLALLREVQGQREAARSLWKEARMRYVAAGVTAGVEECDTRLEGL